MEVTSETLKEAVEELLHAEAEISANSDRRQWRALFRELRRREDNLDCIITRLSDGWFRMDGASSKLFVCALAYRARTKRFFVPSIAGRMSELDKKVQYNLRDQAKARLKQAVETWNDAEACRQGKAVRWHLMRKRCGVAHSVLSSTDRHYVEVELRDALGRMQPGEGEWYFVAKEYVEPNKTRNKDDK